MGPQKQVSCTLASPAASFAQSERRHECVHAGVPTLHGNETASPFMASSSLVHPSPSPTLLSTSSAVVFFSQTLPTLSVFSFLLSIALIVLCASVLKMPALGSLPDSRSPSFMQAAGWVSSLGA